MKKLLLLLVALLPMVASAYDAEVDGIYYDISEDGASVTYRDDNYNSYSGQVIIPPSVDYGGVTYPVTSIGNYAFGDCYELNDVSIPSSVTSIGDYAFSNCYSLSSIAIPEGVTTIGEWAFLNCTALTSISIPNSVTSIGDYAFYYCEQLTSFAFPEGVTTTGDHTLAYCRHPVQLLWLVCNRPFSAHKYIPQNI